MAIDLTIPDVRIVAVETCDFGRIPAYGTEEVLRAAYPGNWQRYLETPVALELVRRLGVDRRHLTHLPGRPPDPGRPNALDLARSAVERLADRMPGAPGAIDALLFVSTSNPYPCSSQAALLAHDLGIRASCFDLKAGCSGGVLGLVQAGMLISAGCGSVLVVMAENLSQVTGTGDARMVLTVGDGAACVLLERHPGAGFVAALHGTEPEHARAIAIPTPFPPASPAHRYEYEVDASGGARDAMATRWISVARRAAGAAGIEPSAFDAAFVHQATAWQLDALVRELGLEPSRVPDVVRNHGNMGSPTFAVAMAAGLDRLQTGSRMLIEAVGGGMSWGAIAAVHA